MTKIGNMIFFVFVASLSLGLTANVSRAATQVDGLIDRETVAVWEQFVFTVSVSSTESISADEPSVPAIEGARVVNTSTSNSTSTKMIQGAGGWQFDTVRRSDFSYVMVAQQTGTITIPPFTVVVNGQTFKTKPVRVKVVNQGQAPQNQPQARGGLPGTMDELLDDPDELFRQLMQRRMGPPAGGGGQFGAGGGLPTPGTVVPKNPNELFFIHTDVDKRQAYEGEQITVNWSIYVKGNLVALDRTKFPDLKGFWKEIIEEVPALQFSQEVINGQVYRRALLASHALFPIKEGTATIDEYKIKGQVQAIGGGGFGQTYSVNRSSERVPIKVLPLPKDNRPGDFSGAVGDFQVQAILDNNVVPAHQPFSLKIRFEGSGNAKLIEMPNIDWPAGLEMYETKSDSKFFKNGQSYKQFDVLLIPRQEGDLLLPAITVSLFDPKTSKYYTRTTEPIQIKVLPGAPGAQMAAKPIAEGAKKPELPQGPVLPGPVLEKAGASAVVGGGTPVGWGLVGFSYLGIFGFLGLRGFRDLWSGPRAKDLAAILKKGLSRSRSYAKQGDFRQTGISMINLIDEILGGVSGQQGVDQEVKKALDQIPPSLRRNVGPDLLKWMEVFQTISFAPEEVIKDFKSSEQLNKQIDGAEKTLNQVLKLSAKASEET